MRFWATVWVAVLLGGFGTLGGAFAQSCQELAGPIQTHEYGLWPDEIDTADAQKVCSAELATTPDDHALIAHNARIADLDGRTEDADRLVARLKQTGEPDALALLADRLNHAEGDPALAATYYKRAAKSGHLYAAAKLAAILVDETTQPFDLERGHKLRRDAARDGGVLAARDLGHALRDGVDGETADPAAAIGWLEKATAGRSARAMTTLALTYLYVFQGVEPDEDTALMWANRAAERGDTTALIALADAHWTGQYVRYDRAKAEALYRRAGDLGDADAYAKLSQNYYEKGERAYSGFRDEEAVNEWRKAADLGHAEALRRLALAYYSGEILPEDKVESMRLAALAAEKGSPIGQRLFGFHQIIGTSGYKDYALAAEYFAKAAAAKETSALYELGRAYLKGRGVEKDEARGVEMMTQAAEQGYAAAYSNLSHYYYEGIGVEASIEKAKEYATRGATTNSWSQWHAAENLAFYYLEHPSSDHDFVRAKTYYRQAAENGETGSMIKMSELLIDEGTDDALEEAAEFLVQAATDWDEEARLELEAAFDDEGHKLHAVVTSPSEALQEKYIKLGRKYGETRANCVLLLIDCSGRNAGSLDVDYAATWYRRAGENPQAKFLLGVILSFYPDLAKVASEGADALAFAETAGNPDAGLFVALEGSHGRETERAMHSFLDQSDPKDAARMAVAAVSGRFGDDAIGPGWTWLSEQAAKGDPAAQMGRVGAALFLGAFDLAAEELEHVSRDVYLDLSDVDYTVRQTLTFLMFAVRKGVTPEPELLDAMDRLLGQLAARNHVGAGELLLLLKEVRYRLATRDRYEPYTPRTTMSLEDRLEQIDERIASKLEGRGLSPILAAMYRARAHLLADMGRLDDAEASVYRSVAIARQINNQNRHVTGGLIYHLEMACHERKASDLLFELGADAAALALAKSALNELQTARSKLLGLPQEMQDCFRDLLADQYRRIADILIRNGHGAEAIRVLGQLKDLETFRYTGDDVARVGTSFDHVALSDDQSAILSRIHGLPVETLITLEQEHAALPETDTAGRSTLEAKMQAARLDLADSLDALSDSVDALDTRASRALAQEVSSRTLRRMAKRLGKLDSVALVYSVSLPERTHFLVVTTDGTEHHELEIERTDLHDQIEALRAALSNPSQDPMPAAETFYSKVWAGVDKSLERLAQDSQVLLVLDGRMRYVPVPALRGPSGWLVEGHRYATFTPATLDLLLDDETIDDLRVEALGASRGGQGFTPLPYVREEVSSIVGLDDATPAIAEGRARLDDGFDSDALRQAFGSGAPIVHVATHFDLTEDEASSRLLLGTGDTLSVAALKQDLRKGALDVGEVQMLVLSACSTGFVGGAELESLAGEMQAEGVSTVVATLWPVNDQSTALFMAAFYAKLKDGASRSQSLHDVQTLFSEGRSHAEIALATRGAMSLEDEDDKTPATTSLGHPFYWAGFQMIGQWR